MENRNKHIDDLFREGLGNYAETPPAMAWDVLEKRLDDRGDRRKPFLWWWFAIGIVLLSLLGYFIVRNMTKTTVPKHGINKEAGIDTTAAVPVAKDSTQPMVLNTIGGTGIGTKNEQRQNGVITKAATDNVASKHIDRNRRQKKGPVTKRENKRNDHRHKNNKITIGVNSRHRAAKERKFNRGHNNGIAHTKPPASNGAAMRHSSHKPQTGNVTIAKKQGSAKRQQAGNNLSLNSSMPVASADRHGNRSTKPGVNTSGRNGRHVRDKNEVASSAKQALKTGDGGKQKTTAGNVLKPKRHGHANKPLSAIAVHQASQRQNHVKNTWNKNSKPAEDNKYATTTEPGNASEKVKPADINESTKKDKDRIATLTKPSRTTAHKPAHKGKSVDNELSNSMQKPKPVIAHHKKMTGEKTTAKHSRKPVKNKVITAQVNMPKQAESNIINSNTASAIGGSERGKRQTVIPGGTKQKINADDEDTKNDNALSINPIAAKAKKRSINPKPAPDKKAQPIEPVAAKSKKRSIHVKPARNAKPPIVEPVAAKGKKKGLQINPARGKKVRPIGLVAAKSKKRSIGVKPARKTKPPVIEPVAAKAKKRGLQINPARGGKASPIEPVAAKSKKKRQMRIKAAPEGKPRPINPVAATSKKKDLNLDASSGESATAFSNKEHDNSNQRGTNVANARNNVPQVNSGDVSINMTTKKGSRNFKNVPPLQTPAKPDILSVEQALKEPVETFLQAKPMDRERQPDYLKVQTMDVGSGGDSRPDMPNYGPTQKKQFSRYEMGLKLGLESGTGSNAANKRFIAPFLQYNVNTNLSFILQPAFKLARISNTQLSSSSGSYYNSTSDTAIMTAHTIVVDTAFPHDTSWKTTYHYTQQYDSIIAKNKLSATSYFEVEIPILLQYRLVKNFFVLGGVSMIYSRIPGIESSSQVVGTGQLDTTRSYTVAGNNPTPPQPENINTVFPHTGSSPFSSFNPVSFASKGQLRIGYMIGFNYALKDRLLFDVMIQQNLSTISNLQDQNLKDIYAQPYFHITLGYKLYRSKQQGG